MIPVLEDVTKAIRIYLPDADVTPIERAAALATRAHDGQKRKSGEPYIVHPFGVARNLAELRLDVPSICAALLHDCIEDTDVGAEEIRAQFGDDVLFLVEGVTKLDALRYTSREERQAENFRKMVLATGRDIRVVLIKLADRLDNMRTLGHMPEEKQERIARETKEIYAPIASRLGIQWMKTELEDLCFRYLYPEDFAAVADQVAKLERHRKRFVRDTVKLIEEEMALGGIEAQVSGRSKHLWGIYQKLKRQGRSIEVGELFDIMAFRIITTSVDRCYYALGRLHARWRPIPNRFKDYIALPKENGYQSLHTSLFGPAGHRIEIQIRTLAMHRTAEQGIAAHWLYKEGKPLRVRDESRYAWLHQLMDDHRANEDPMAFYDSAKLDLFEDEVYVFTPRGDLRSLPRGATPVDFAYAIHSEVGHRCSGARVNGAMVPLKYKLQNGDIVEIITSKSQHPNKDWLKFVATGRAKTKIRHFIRREQRARSAALGRDLLEKELRKAKLSLVKAEKTGKLGEAAQHFRLGSPEELILQVGFGKILAADVLARIAPEAASNGNGQQEPGVVDKLLERVGVKRPSRVGIRVQGVEDMLVRYARCCNPVRGEPIVGFITRGRGVTVHTRSCPKAIDLDPARRIEVSWDSSAKNPSSVTVRIETLNRKGILAEVSKYFSSRGVNILGVTARTFNDDYAVSTFQFQIEDLNKLNALTRGISKIDGVLRVERVTSW